VAFSRAEVDRLARLARLRLTEEEADRMTEELRSILGHLEVLRGVEAGPDGEDRGAPPLRPDLESPDPLREPISGVAPEWAEGYFVVPRPPGVGPAEEG
jgi:aspartyl-tRNA(Asn)/glutamyl-tRNA(Gln) amidotransferase subunit C